MVAEVGGDLANQVGTRDGRGVDADLVGARTQQFARRRRIAYAASDGERNEELLGSSSDDVDHRVTSVARRGDVEKHDFVGAFGVVPRGEFDGVARVAQAYEVDALHDSAVGDVSQMLSAPDLISAREARSVLEGVARVLDGETLVINGQRVRLAGIEVPEDLKRCGSARDADVCVTDAIRALRSMVSSAPVRCVVGDEGATCYTGTVDINRELVRSGYAKAYRGYSSTYVDEELAAEAAGRGLWRSRGSQ